ncbi:hypothetical protein [Lacrimispora sp.]|jgi:undecaprenyl pyrophosphate phosphatase UppP|uniref:hypothetical protein n=1 Tax=Lacrimispora sp. TaxID=2719234 RepID=UPI0028ADDCF4|nr:hypothetical protein [Lacrimispora sp.]
MDSIEIQQIIITEIKERLTECPPISGMGDKILVDRIMSFHAIYTIINYNQNSLTTKFTTAIIGLTLNQQYIT